MSMTIPPFLPQPQKVIKGSLLKHYTTTAVTYQWITKHWTK